jgi:hypothetical protein
LCALLSLKLFNTIIKMASSSKCERQREERDAEYSAEFAGCSGEDLSRLAESWYPELKVGVSTARAVEEAEAYDDVAGFVGLQKPNLRPTRIPLRAQPHERTRAGYKAIAKSRHISDLHIRSGKDVRREKTERRTKATKELSE